MASELADILASLGSLGLENQGHLVNRVFQVLDILGLQVHQGQVGHRASLAYLEQVVPSDLVASLVLAENLVRAG